MNNRIINKIATLLKIETFQVENTLKMSEEGATIPFMARYRKEKTGGLTDLQIIDLMQFYQQLNDLEDRRKVILNSLKAQNISNSILIQKIKDSDSLSVLEDLYFPYRPQKKTRAVIAKGKGLEPLAKKIMAEVYENPEKTALAFINKEKNVLSTADALSGASDIVAEWISEIDWVRNFIRKSFHKEAIVRSNIAKNKEEEAINYKNYFEWEEVSKKAPSHRILAMFRGEKEGLLKLKIIPDLNKITDFLQKKLLREDNSFSEIKAKAIIDSVKRILFPTMETEYRKYLLKKAEESSIKVFSENLRQLLLAPPMGRINVLAIDPGFRTGCKIVCLDKNGNLLHNETIYPHPPKKETSSAIKKIKSLVSAYNIEAISIGNGTGGRETEDLIRRIPFNREIKAVMVNEDGASVYSVSNAARKEFPDFDVTVRGAISIGRRLQDPLAEIVKIDPKSMGVGQYQHDINSNLLKDTLQTTVELCVNAVGVDLNLASEELLSFVSGIGTSMASKIITHRNKIGAFKNRKELKDIKGFGDKAFEQAAGFLRITNGDEPLDASSVHPENYNIVRKIANKTGLSVKELIGNKKLRAMINLEDFISDKAGIPTLQDILNELEKPGRDPRKSFQLFHFDQNIRTIDDIKPGIILPGVVTNITDFGAFINLGIHENGLLHKSQIANEYVSHPSDYLRINQQLKVKVIDIDKKLKRISLSLKY